MAINGCEPHNKKFFNNFLKKVTASISTGSWLSKQPGQVFDISSLV